jgi:Bax protein
MNNLLKTISMSVLFIIIASCGDSGDKKEQQQEQPIIEKIIKIKKEKDKPIQKQEANETTSKYSIEIVPKNITVRDKKKRFKALLLPAVIEVYDDLEKQYLEIGLLISTNPSDAKLLALKKSYKATSNVELLIAIKPHPKSIALAQAAMESAWGTSRFFREARNVFGVWSFDKNEPRLAAGEKRGKKTIWVKKYPTIKAAIRDYYRVLARGHAFDAFRKQKMLSADPYELVKKLDNYSEKGAEYGKELASMIKYNKFYLYD